MNSDNTSRDVENDEYEVFDMSKVAPLNDPDCNHFFIEEVHEEIDGYTAWTCEKCRRGTYLPKGHKVINT